MIFRINQKFITLILTIFFLITIILNTPCFSEDKRLQQTNYVTKKYCLSIFGRKSEDVKEELLLKAKQEAAKELYGELINSEVFLKNGIIKKDEVLSQTYGLLRIKGDPHYYNSSNLGECCVSITAYITYSDKLNLRHNKQFQQKRFSPKKVNNHQCQPGYTYAKGMGSISQQCIKKACSYAQKKIKARTVAVAEAEKLIAKGRHISEDYIEDGTSSSHTKRIKSAEILKSYILDERIEGDLYIVDYCVELK